MSVICFSMSVEHWWDDSGSDLSQCHFVHHKSHIDFRGERPSGNRVGHGAVRQCRSYPEGHVTTTRHQRKWTTSSYCLGNDACYCCITSCAAVHVPADTLCLGGCSCLWGGSQAALIKRAILNFWNFVVWRGERLEMADCCSCCEGGGGGGGGVGGRCVGLTTLEIWEPQPLETLRACPGL